MITHVSFVSIPVRDQEKALVFYIEKLGFEIITDQPFGNGMRWIELLPPGAQTKVVLFTMDEHKDRIGTFSNITFACEDVRRTYEELRERGVEFTVPPTDQPWGIYAQFTDPDGNQFVLSTNNSTHSAVELPVKWVTGIGGIFFKCKDPGKIREWYAEHLGLDVTDYGCNFEWRQSGSDCRKGSTVWSPFKDDTSYFLPSEKDFMVNFRVENLEKLLEILREKGVNTVDAMQEFSYGKFAHIMDPEGNKIELWEPNDAE